MALSTKTSSPGGLVESFRKEFPAVWRGMPDKALFGVLAVAWLLLFQFAGNPTFGYTNTNTSSLFRWVWEVSTHAGSDDGHVVLVPFVVVGLLWWKRGELCATPKQLWLPGLFLLAGCVLLHIAAYLIQQPKGCLLAALAGCWVLMATVWGWRFGLAAMFPMGLLVFCVPIGDMADPLTIPLRRVSTDISVGVARHLLGIPVLQHGVQILDPQGRYQYEVAAACSGIRSLVTLIALMTIYGFVTFRSAWRRLLMILVTLPLAVVGNVIRLVGIVIAAEAFGSRAGEVVHEWFGFVTFALALAVMLALGRWLEEPEAVPAPAGGGAA